MIFTVSKACDQEVEPLRYPDILKAPIPSILVVLFTL